MDIVEWRPGRVRLRVIMQAGENETTSDTHVEWALLAEIGIDLVDEDVNPMRSWPYKVGLKVRYLDKVKIDSRPK